MLRQFEAHDRKWHSRLGMIAAIALLMLGLAACGSTTSSSSGPKTDQGYVFKSAADCQKNSGALHLTAAQCETAFNNATAEAAKTAPTFTTSQSCVAKWGRCDSRRYQNKGVYVYDYFPLYMAFMMYPYNSVVWPLYANYGYANPILYAVSSEDDYVDIDYYNDTVTEVDINDSVFDAVDTSEGYTDDLSTSITEDDTPSADVDYTIADGDTDISYAPTEIDECADSSCSNVTTDDESTAITSDETQQTGVSDDVDPTIDTADIGAGYDGSSPEADDTTNGAGEDGGCDYDSCATTGEGTTTNPDGDITVNPDGSVTSSEPGTVEPGYDPSDGVTDDNGQVTTGPSDENSSVTDNDGTDPDGDQTSFGDGGSEDGNSGITDNTGNEDDNSGITDNTGSEDDNSGITDDGGGDDYGSSSSFGSEDDTDFDDSMGAHNLNRSFVALLPDGSRFTIRLAAAA